MKKLLLFASLLLCFFSNVKADNISASLKVESDLTTATLHVNLTNSASYVAFQMDVDLPSGWTVTGAEPVASSRLINGGSNDLGSTNFVLAYNVIGGNKLRVIAYNLGNVAISGTSGDELFSIQLTKSEAAEAITSWVGTISNVEFVTSDDLEEIEMAVANSTVTGESATVIGDVNKDGVIDISDILAVIDISLGKDTTGYDLAAADANNDGKYDISDILLVINISLGK